MLLAAQKLVSVVYILVSMNCTARSNGKKKCGKFYFLIVYVGHVR